jgi:hypothetical protein
MSVGQHSPEVPIGLLLPDPPQKALQRGRLPEGLNRVVELRQVGIRERCVELLVARLAQRRAILGLATFLPRHVSLAELTDFRFPLDVPHPRILGGKALAADKRG